MSQTDYCPGQARLQPYSISSWQPVSVVSHFTRFMNNELCHFRILSSTAPSVMCRVIKQQRLYIKYNTGLKRRLIGETLSRLLRIIFGYHCSDCPDIRSFKVVDFCINRKPIETFSYFFQWKTALSSSQYARVTRSQRTTDRRQEACTCTL